MLRQINDTYQIMLHRVSWSGRAFSKWNHIACTVSVEKPAGVLDNTSLNGIINVQIWASLLIAHDSLIAVG